MRKRNYRAQKVNEIRWEEVFDRVKERTVVWAMDVAKGRTRGVVVGDDGVEHPQNGGAEGLKSRVGIDTSMTARPTMVALSICAAALPFNLSPTGC